MKGRRRVVALLVLTVAGCSSAPASPGPSAVDLAPTSSPIGDMPGDGPPTDTLQQGPSQTPAAAATGLASAAPTGFTGGPGDDPWTGPAGAWPGQILFTYPTTDGISYIIGVASDGTVYTHTTVYAAESYEAIRAFRPDGSMSPSWPADGVHIAGLLEDAVVGTDGGVYVAMGPLPKAGSSGGDPGPSTITALDSTGQVRPGWPYLTPATIYHAARQLGFGHSLFVRPSGQVCRVQKTMKSPVSTAATKLVCLGIDGRPVADWTYDLPSILGTPAFGPDGTLYVVEAGRTSVAHVVALGPGGRPLAGWTPVAVSAAVDSQVVVGPDGTVFALQQQPFLTKPLLIAVAPDGTSKPEFDTNVAAILAPLGPEAFIQPLNVTPDGTLYLMVLVLADGPSEPSQILALGPDGMSRPGWPFRPGSLYLFAQPAPDGSIWVWMSNANAVTPRLAVLGSDGAMQSGFPVLAPPPVRELAFDRQGRPFLVVSPNGRDYLETIDRGQR